MVPTKMITDCIEQAELLKRAIEQGCDLPKGCLGGQMLAAYENARAKQLSDMKEICQRLYLLQVIFQAADIN